MTEPRQGQVWILTSRLSGRTTSVVLLDTDVVISQRSLLVAAPVREAREVPSRQQLLTVALGDGEVAALYDLAVVAKDNLTEHVDTVPAAVMEQIKIGLRARFDL